MVPPSGSKLRGGFSDANGTLVLVGRPCIITLTSHRLSETSLGTRMWRMLLV